MIGLEPRKRESQMWQFGSPVLALTMTVLTGALLFSALGKPALETLAIFFIDPVSDVYGLSELLVKLTPLLLCSLGLYFCFKAQVWNIGAEGQFVMGALAGGAVALNVGELDKFIALPLVLICGSAAGALWAGIAAWLRTSFGASEILSTIMLNYIAVNLLLYAVHGPLKDPEGYSFPESALFAENTMLAPLHIDYRVNAAFLIALVLVLVCWWLHRNSFLVFKLRVQAAAPRAARFSGINSKAMVWLVLLVSGAAAGLAGVSEVAGPIGQLTPYLSTGYGYTAIIVVFLARLHPLGILAASVLLSLMFLGGENLQVMAGLPKSVSLVFQGMLLFFLLVTDVMIRYQVKFNTDKSSPELAL
jgi:general nucleoside transport system permease protein